MVRAKFTCNSVTITKDGYQVSLSPVINGSEENKDFYKYTPSGNILLATINNVAGDYFKPGKEYYVDFTISE